MSGYVPVADAVEKHNPEAGTTGRLKKACEENVWSLNELEKRSGVTHPVINRAEFGAKLTEKQGKKLAAALEIGFDWLMKGEENKRKWPVDQKMIDWLWQHEDVRHEILDRTNAKD